MEVGVLQVCGEDPHSLIERSSYGLGSLHLEIYCGQKGVQEFEIYYLDLLSFWEPERVCCRGLEC